MSFRRLVCLLVISIFGCVGNLNAQDYRTDSLAISKTVSRFYDWYLSAIKTQKGAEYQPRFDKSSNGMTTLSFSVYLRRLKEHDFSDSLIFREKKSYQKCLGNLQKIKYADFDSNYNDLESIERIDCDFGNVYRWISGQEYVDRIRINEIKMNDKTNALVYIDKGFYNSEENKYNYYAGVSVTLVKIRGVWKIDDVRW